MIYRPTAVFPALSINAYGKKINIRFVERHGWKWETRSFSPVTDPFMSLRTNIHSIHDHTKNAIKKENQLWVKHWNRKRWRKKESNGTFYFYLTQFASVRESHIVRACIHILIHCNYSLSATASPKRIYPAFVHIAHIRQMNVNSSISCAHSRTDLQFLQTHVRSHDTSIYLINILE